MINKARILNARVCVAELVFAAICLVVATRTNQGGLITRFVVTDLATIVVLLYIHISHKINFFRQAMQGLIVMQLYMTMLIYEMLVAMFTFTHLCSVIDKYYEKLNV